MATAIEYGLMAAGLSLIVVGTINVIIRHTPEPATSRPTIFETHICPDDIIDNMQKRTWVCISATSYNYERCSNIVIKQECTKIKPHHQDQSAKGKNR